MKNIPILLILALLSGWIKAQSYVPESDNSRVKVKPVVDIKSYSFHLGEVDLLESPFKKAMEADVKYLIAIEPDRLLSQFRSHSGLKPKGEMGEFRSCRPYLRALSFGLCYALCCHPGSAIY